MAAPRKIRDPAELEAELERVRTEYNTVRLHAAIGYLAQTTNTKAAARVFVPGQTETPQHARITSRTNQHENRP
jgi:hypothetical protein